MTVTDVSDSCAILTTDSVTFEHLNIRLRQVILGY